MGEDPSADSRGRRDEFNDLYRAFAGSWAGRYRQTLRRQVQVKVQVWSQVTEALFSLVHQCQYPLPKHVWKLAAWWFAFGRAGIVLAIVIKRGPVPDQGTVCRI